MLRTGDRLGDWVVDQVLGEGGMGAVYRVHSVLTDRLEAALKVMKPSVDPEARPRFVREAEALSGLRHPAIVRVMGFGQDQQRGWLYLVMELAEGPTLKARLEQKPLGVREALGIFLPLAAALEHAHSAGIFHRDLKPANIVLCLDGTVRLVDFGVAAAQANDTLTRTGHLGTLAYLPPEVFRGDRPEPSRLDVYAFGLMLYEALTGERPFIVDRGLTPAAAAATVGLQKLQHAGVALGAGFPPELRDIVRRATDADPARRPSMRDLRAALEQAVSAVSDGAPMPIAVADPSLAALWTELDRTTRVPDPTPSSDYHVPRSRDRRRRERRRSRRWLLAALFVGAAAGAILALAWGLAGTARSGEDEAPSRLGARSTAPTVIGPERTPLPSPSPTPSAPAEDAAGVEPAVPAEDQPTGSLAPEPTPTPDDMAPGDPPEEAEAEFPLLEPEPIEEDEPSPPEPTPEPDVDLSGRWQLTNWIETSEHGPYQGLRLGYRLTLEQDGARVYGYGHKLMENGVLLPPAARTPISVEGRIVGPRVVLRFRERGASRESGGMFRWELSDDPGQLSGSFTSDVADSRGTSLARRLP